MPDELPRTTHRVLQFDHGTAIGMSHRWEKGQYCSILTAAGIVGCGIYDLKTPAEFGQAIAIAKGTPACPLTEPEDLFDARIVGLTPKAARLGISVGMTGREAVERMLMAGNETGTATANAKPLSGIAVKSIDHVTLVVKDLESSRRFYVDVLGMREVPRPAFTFAGSWFQAGKTQIHLILEYAGSGPAGNWLPQAQRGPRTQHLAFEVADALAVHEQLKQLGVAILSPPKPRPDGWMQVFVTDPDGHVVELCSPAPAV
jgi:catechol 2,3-dioxygenase-like lactoylglutathione lyase family enzyme/uncharacterized protein YunC (DUF1805 family)